MSSGNLISLDEGALSASRMSLLFPRSTFSEWMVAGSIRRKAPQVRDVEHVILPKLGESAISSQDLFEQGLPAPTVNLFWEHLDQLERMGFVTRAKYGEAQRERWGEKYRGVMFEGVRHEFFMADVRNYGLILAIRTGPAEFSQRLVTALRDRGHASVGGYIQNAGHLPALSESMTLELAGMKWIEPEKRS